MLNMVEVELTIVAGTDGNHGESGPVTGAIAVEVAKDDVGGNTDGGYVEYGGGRVDDSCWEEYKLGL
jgi:hypothetical protein